VTIWQIARRGTVYLRRQYLCFQQCVAFLVGATSVIPGSLREDPRVT